MTAALYIAIVRDNREEVARLIAEGGHLTDDERKRLSRSLKS